MRRLRGGRGRPLGLLCLALMVGTLLAPEIRPLRALRLASFDIYQIAAPRIRRSAPAVIVEVDDASLARHGQWPWPRTLLARLVARIAESDPAAIGFDMVMPEPDRLSPGRLPAILTLLDPDLAARLARLPSNDAALGAAMRGRPVVMGLAGFEGPGRRPPHATPVRVHGDDPRPFVRHFEAALSSVDEIDTAASGHGLLNTDADARVVRRVPLVATVGPALVPGLAVEMLRVAAGQPSFSVHASHAGVSSVGIQDLRIPTQPDGTMWIHFASRDAGRFVSAAAVLAGTADPGRFTRRLVLVGVTALGLGDHAVTPVAGSVSGVEIHAQALENIFDGDLLHRPPFMLAVEVALLAAGGLLVIFVVPVLAVHRALLLAVPTLAAVPVLGFALYRLGHLLLDGASPTLGLTVLFTAMLIMGLLEADSQRRTLRRQLMVEREAAARLAGELEAGRRIQMGILPDPARAFPGETRLSLYARLEPAREVGGDLYDFFRLDGDRVFLLVGDVSGKGLPGALFMAVTKSLTRSTALRRHAGTAAVLAEVNAEISRENAEALFVTVFAAILDTRTGEVEYCNAGHETPHVIPADGRPLETLAEGGGPPLCVVDDFAYVPATHRLRPGDRLCVVTDGVTEAMNPEGQCYGRARLAALLAAARPDATPEQIGEAIREDVTRFVAGAEASDDQAVLVVRWTGPGSR